jgi:hypothetical protein
LEGAHSWPNVPTGKHCFQTKRLAAKEAPRGFIMRCKRNKQRLNITEADRREGVIKIMKDFLEVEQRCVWSKFVLRLSRSSLQTEALQAQDATYDQAFLLGFFVTIENKRARESELLSGRSRVAIAPGPSFFSGIRTSRPLF